MSVLGNYSELTNVKTPTKEMVRGYFEAWRKEDDSYKHSVTQFIEMLQSKAYFAKLNGTKVIAHGEHRDGRQLEAMLQIADDIL